MIQVISFKSSHLPEVLIWLLASSLKSPSAAMLTNCSWWALVQRGGDVLWHLLSASTLFILFLQLLTHPQPHLLAFCPPAVWVLHSPGTRQLHNCTSLPSRQAFPQTENWQPQIFLNQLWILNYLLHTYKTKAIKKPKQIHSPRQTKNKMKIPCWNKISPCMLVCPGEKTWNEDDRHLLHSSVHYLRVLRWYKDELDESRA